MFVVEQWTKKRDWLAQQNNPKASVWLSFSQKLDQIISVRAGNSIISLIRQAATFLACLTQGQFYGPISGNETEGSDWPISCLRKHGPASKPRGKKNPQKRTSYTVWRSGGKLRTVITGLTSTGSAVTRHCSHWSVNKALTSADSDCGQI